MKSISFTFVSVLVSFHVSDASNIDHLQEYMQTNLLQVAFGPFVMINDSNQRIRSFVCPRELKIAWQVRPPFTLGKNASEDQSIDGIFHQALDFALEKCCAFFNGKRPVMRYLAESENSSALHGNIFSGDTNLVFPIQDDLYIDKRRWRYINILDSPGTVLVRREATYSNNKGGELVKAILGTWPIVVLSLLMSSLAGVCIWMLDTRTNPTEFKRPFYLGVFDGFWWAFVTMSTVGYGDKTPKSISGRLFSVVWIMTGITVCSILTATLSSALTSVTVSVERYDVTTGKTVGARKESFAFKHAVNLGINVTDFNDLYEAHHLLENGKVEAILEEMFTAIEFIKGKAELGLSIAKVLEEKHGYGAAIKKDGFSNGVWDCLPNLMEFVSYEIYTNTSNLLKYVKRSYTPIKNLAGTEVTNGDQNIFDQNSHSFKATALGVSVFLFVFTAGAIGFVGVRYLRRKPEKKKKAVDLEAGRK